MTKNYLERLRTNVKKNHNKATKKVKGKKMRNGDGKGAKSGKKCD